MNIEIPKPKIPHVFPVETRVRAPLAPEERAARQRRCAELSGKIAARYMPETTAAPVTGEDVARSDTEFTLQATMPEAMVENPDLSSYVGGETSIDHSGIRGAA